LFRGTEDSTHYSSIGIRLPTLNYAKTG